jgi:hypothetical protein
LFLNIQFGRRSEKETSHCRKRDPIDSRDRSGERGAGQPLGPFDLFGSVLFLFKMTIFVKGIVIEGNF